jgi:hypothetical protein
MIRRELHYAMWRWIELGYRLDASKIRNLTNDLRIVCNRLARKHQQPDSLMDLSNDVWQRQVELAMSREAGRPLRCSREVRQSFQNERLLLVFLYDRRAWWKRDLWAPIHDSRIPVGVNEPCAEHSLHLWTIEPSWLSLGRRRGCRSRASWKLAISGGAPCDPRARTFAGSVSFSTREASRTRHWGLTCTKSAASCSTSAARCTATS